MVKRNHTKQSHKKSKGGGFGKQSAQQKQAYQAKVSPTETNQHGIEKKKTKSRRNAKTTRQKKTKRIGHKSTNRKGAHHDEHHHIQTNDTMNTSHE
ncbi:unnamed protein product [Adineta steineri]|uniref:Uncharacterized protein n=1 Tax=Adineta steineri TaxID=433720 RepID=A0A815GE58_9BILA|nr:unnamed protein product [Adineta steineri]CAF3775656.1 unnamed protein product [Adineta steineri]